MDRDPKANRKGPALKSLDDLFYSYFPGASYDCGDEEEPGIDETPEWRDWTGLPTTAGEKRIIDFLSQEAIQDKRLLHIGVGNSSLAVALCDQLSRCLGTTIQEAEVLHGEGLGLSNYAVLRLNKFSHAFADLRFCADWIVDSNPTTFACCFKHLYRMLCSYRDRLHVDGRLVTEAKGLRHVSSANSSPEPWSLSPGRWGDFLAEFGFTTRTHDRAVIVSTKC